MVGCQAKPVEQRLILNTDFRLNKTLGVYEPMQREYGRFLFLDVLLIPE
jgi:hypothetical protein